MKVLICDDDRFMLKLNKIMVEEYLIEHRLMKAQFILRQAFKPEEDALIDVDIAILDIDLEDSMNGLEIAQIIKKRNPYVSLIFVTGYSSYALDAWQLHSCGFLKKPVVREEFNEVFTKAIFQLRGIKISRMSRLIEFNSRVSVLERDIYYIEKVSGTKNIKVTTRKEVFVIRGTIKELEKKLSQTFVKISRDVLINTLYIYKIEDGTIELSNEKVFVISANKTREVTELCSIKHVCL